MRAHISINVRDVQASVDFYRQVFGAPPQKQTDTYAKFDLEDPPLNFAMQSSSGVISEVNHFGIEVDSRREVARWEARLRERGLVDGIEKGVSCCYAVQDKVWFKDPDGNHWEVFTVVEQLPLTAEQKETPCRLAACCAS